MQKLNLNTLIEYDDEKFRPKVLMNEPGYRMVLLSMRAWQHIPEHASKGMVTVHAILGHVTLFAGSFPDELYAGEVICIESGVSHRIEAVEDSALLVLSTGGTDSSMGHSEELDLCQVPRPQLLPLVLERFDALVLGESFVLTTDHNPVLLNRDLENIRPGQVAWEHLNRGPDRYRIRIRRVAPLHASDNLIPARPEAYSRNSQYVRTHTPDTRGTTASKSSMITTAPEPTTLPLESYLNSEYGLRSWLLTQGHKRIALLYPINHDFFCDWRRGYA